VSLKDQIVFIDRALREPALRGRFVAGDVSELSGDDGAMLTTMDGARLSAFASYLCEKVALRFWWERFPATVRATAWCLSEGASMEPALVARAVMQSPWFERAEGEDRTGIALLGWLTQELAPPRWLREIAAYEYLLNCGLPRLADGHERCLELEAALTPELLLLEPPAGDLAAGSVALDKRVAWVCFEHPVGEFAQAFLEGQVRAETLAFTEPQGIALAVFEDAVVELEACWPDTDLIQLCAAPQQRAALDELFPGCELDPLIEELVELGLLRCG
jgi:hypothetical protein